MHKENLKKKRRDLEQASLDAASDLLDTDSNATFAMVYSKRQHFCVILFFYFQFSSVILFNFLFTAMSVKHLNTHEITDHFI